MLFSNLSHIFALIIHDIVTGVRIDRDFPPNCVRFFLFCSTCGLSLPMAVGNLNET